MRTTEIMNFSKILIKFDADQAWLKAFLNYYLNKKIRLLIKVKTDNKG